MITVLYFWKIPSRSISSAFLSMALDRFGIKRIQGVTFSKSLGCGNGTNFTPSDADMHRWGLLVCLPEESLTLLDDSPSVLRWRRRASSEFRVVLDPISAHGEWSGQSPFIVEEESKTHSGEIATVTRARIAPKQILRFWKSIPPVAESLHSSPGLLIAIGIGEAPIGLQGTFSLWSSMSDMRNFAFKGEAHRSAINDTERFHWYSEELFARFAVREKRGTF